MKISKIWRSRHPRRSLFHQQNHKAAKTTANRSQHPLNLMMRVIAAAESTATRLKNYLAHPIAEASQIKICTPKLWMSRNYHVHPISSEVLWHSLVEESLCSLREYRDLFWHLTVGKRTEPIQPYRHFIAYIYCVEMSTLGGEFRGSNLDLYTLEEELSLK